jgi:hypothetical protein
MASRRCFDTDYGKACSKHCPDWRGLERIIVSGDIVYGIQPDEPGPGVSTIALR